MAEGISFLGLNAAISVVLFIISLITPLLQMLILGKADQHIPYLPYLFETVLRYSLFLNIGCSFIVGSAGQFLYAQEIASSMHWVASPFQYELGFSELALGILGLLCALFNDGFKLATLIAACVWLWGAAGVQLYHSMNTPHMYELSFNMLWNSLLPVWLLGLYGLYCRAKQTDPKKNSYDIFAAR